MMQRIISTVLIGVVVTLMGGKPTLAVPESLARRASGNQCPPARGNAQIYDVIVFGDEVPGVMTAIKIKEEFSKRQKFARVAVVTEGDVARGIGGHLVRGGLAYLDRNLVPPQWKSRYGVYGVPSRLYQTFLRSTGTKLIALDRFKAAKAFTQALEARRIDVIGNIQLKSVKSKGSLVCSFVAKDNVTKDKRVFAARQFIDASQGAELAEKSGVAMRQGFDALGLPDSTLSLGLVLDVYGLSIERLQQLEVHLTERLLNPQDQQAQKWLTVASGKNEAKRRDLLAALVDSPNRPKLMYHPRNEDFADVRSLAFSIAVHGTLGQEYNLKASGFLFDRANIAILEDRLSFNALLFYADFKTARRLSQSNAQPTRAMRKVAMQIAQIFRGWGASKVEIMDELYVRSAGQIAKPVDELTATLMAAGGVPDLTALGTFSYHLDDRGGIDGLEEKVAGTALATLNYRHKPNFNFGWLHTLPQERQNLVVLGPGSGFGGLGNTAGRIVEFNVSVGEGVAIAITKALTENRSLHSIPNFEVRKSLGYIPAIYGHSTQSFQALYQLEGTLRDIDYRQTHLDRGIVYLKQGNYEKATQELARAAILGSNQPTAYYHLGDILSYLGYGDIALTVYTKAIRLDPSFGAAYRGRGFVQLGKSNFNQSIADFEQGLRLNPKDADAQFGRGFATALRNIKTQEQPLEQSLPFLNQSIQKQPTLAIAHLVRGLVHIDLDNHQAAQTDLQTASKLFKKQRNQLGYDHAQKSLQNLLGQSSRPQQQ